MRHIRFIIIIACCIGIASCGVQRRLDTRQETGTEHREASSDTSVLSRTVEDIVRRMMDETVERLVSQDREVVHEVFTPPDSTGRQHLAERTVTRTSTSVDEKTGRSVSESSGRTEWIDSAGFSSAASATVQDTSVVRESRTGLQGWQKALILAGVVSVLYMASRLALRFMAR